MIHPLEDRIGHTPLIYLKNISAMTGARIYLKHDAVNPFGSALDRIAFGLVRREYERGQFRNGGCLIQASTGNTGVAMAHLCARLGITFFLVMPEPFDRTCANLVVSMGGKVIFTPRDKGMAGALERAGEMHKDIWISVYPNQFTERESVRIHHDGTGSELVDQCRALEMVPDLFVSSVGSGATFTGVSQRLREEFPGIACAAVGFRGGEGLSGISAGMEPVLFDRELASFNAEADPELAVKTCRRLVFKEGLFCGPTTGANLCSALQIIDQEKLQGRNVIIMGHDGMDRHLAEPACFRAMTL